MTRGTTPVHRFKLPMDPEMIQTMRVIYAQNDSVVLVKTKGDFKFENGWAVTTLSQEETFLFDASQLADVQIRILTTGGEAPASRIRRVPVGRLLEDEVMV